MPADEYRVWCKYHASEGLPDLSLLFAHQAWVTASQWADPKDPPKLDDFLLRPRPPAPEAEPIPLSPEDAADYFKRLMGKRAVDMRVLPSG